MGDAHGDAEGRRRRVQGKLLDLGMIPSTGPQFRNWLGEYLASWKPRSRARCVDRVGWHGTASVLPDRAYGNTAGERMILQTTGTAPEFGTAGTLGNGNTRLRAWPWAILG